MVSIAELVVATIVFLVVTPSKQVPDTIVEIIRFVQKTKHYIQSVLSIITLELDTKASNFNPPQLRELASEIYAIEEDIKNIAFIKSNTTNARVE